jgi:hypothetical protein
MLIVVVFAIDLRSHSVKSFCDDFTGIYANFETKKTLLTPPRGNLEQKRNAKLLSKCDVQFVVVCTMRSLCEIMEEEKQEDGATKVLTMLLIKLFSS